MKVYLLSSAKVVKRFGTARKSVHILCAPQNARHIIARKSSIPHNCSSINRRVIDYVNGHSG